MRLRHLILFSALMCGLFIAAALMAQNDIAGLHKKARELSDAEKFGESNKILNDILKLDPRDRDAYWRLAENAYNEAERLPQARMDEKYKLYQQTEAYARKGMEMDPDLAENYFWTAVGISQQAVVKGIARSLYLAQDMEKMYTETLTRRSVYQGETDDTITNAHFALCEYYRKVPESRLMSLIFGTRGDMDKAVEHCTVAANKYPTNIEYAKELGMCYLCRGKRRGSDKDVEEGRKWLNKAMSIPAKDSLERIDQADSKKVLADPSLACGYSRVQQEEVSDTAIKK